MCFKYHEKKVCLCTLLLMGVFCLSLVTAKWQPEALAKSPNVSSIVYDPSSGSYFEYIRRGSRVSGNWASFRIVVNNRFHKGIRGRLAVIKTRTTHKFLQKNLGIKRQGAGAWIGLRYHCASRKLIWITGEILRRGVDFEIWNRKLYYGAGGTICRNVPGLHLVAYYILDGMRLSWKLSGSAHAITGAVVEYPTR